MEQDALAIKLWDIKNDWSPRPTDMLAYDNWVCTKMYRLVSSGISMPVTTLYCFVRPHENSNTGTPAQIVSVSVVGDFRACPLSYPK